MRVFNPERATVEGVVQAAHAFHRARPFPHVVLDHWFDPAALEALEREFDRPTTAWHQYEDNKRGLMNVADVPFVQAMQTGVGFEMIRSITGVQPLEADPTLRGGGLHAVGPGGRLGIHVDFNRHPQLPLRRTINTLLYLNRDWDPAWHGALTLTDREHAEWDQRLDPIWNRWVIFEYSETSWHGHPEPLTCPSDRERRALALYYYIPLDDLDLEFHTTIYADKLPA